MSGPSPSGSPMVSRRGQLGVPARAAKGQLAAPKAKLSVHKSIDSMVSTGSQAEYGKPEQTLIIFDWDDTLCPSSWIRANKHYLSFFKPAPNNESFQKPLRELQKQCEALLKLAITLGNVIIVTNAVHPWVETSCRNFLPSLLPLLTQLPIIYARSVYETQCCEPPQGMKVPRGSAMDAVRAGGALGVHRAMPGMYSALGQNRLHNHNMRLASQHAGEINPQRWKEVAFEQEITGFYSRYQHQSWKNVISIGDSIFERDAIRRVVPQRPSKKKCRAKTMKLFDDPDIDDLIQQVRVIQEVLQTMVHHDGDLDIELNEEDLNLEALSIVDKINE